MPDRLSVARPESSVVVCALPRSGSSLLAQLLFSSGSVGWPGEWFWLEDVERNWVAWEVSGWRDYLDRVLDEGTAANGVFGVKLMWGYLHEVLFELRRLSAEYDADDLTVLSAFFPQPRFVWMRRDDVVAQAVSWAKAVQTGQWTSSQPKTGEPRFDFGQIDALYNVARVHDGHWRRWFAAHSIEPIGVIYEDLCVHTVGVVRDVLSSLGIEPQPDAIIDVPAELTRQSDSVNADWCARYRELAGL
jgi:trehalose 2-sulfotransferase